MEWQKLTTKTTRTEPPRKSSSSLHPSSPPPSGCWEWTSELQELSPILVMYGIFILLTVSVGLAISIIFRPDFAWTPPELAVPLMIAGLGTGLVVAGVVCYICVGENGGIFARRRMRGRYAQQSPAGGDVAVRYPGESSQFLRVYN